MTDLLGDFTIRYFLATLIGGMAWALAISGKVNPWLILGLGFIGSSACLAQAARILLQYGNYRLGLLGEQVVGQILDQLSSESVRVFHDIEVREPGKRPWNIDHIVVTTAGVFSIESKTRRKPRAPSANGQKGHQVVYDGNQLVFPEPMKPDRHGLEQADRNARWLSSKLGDLNGESVPVTPVLVFPGWWVEAKGKGSVSVMNAKQLPGFISGRQPILSATRFRAISAQLDERSRIDLSIPI